MSAPLQASITENLVQYIIDESSLTDSDVVDGVVYDTDLQDVVLVRESGGISRTWPDNFQQASVQILSRAVTDERTARDNAFTVWNTLRQKEHNVILPASTAITGGATVDVSQIDVEGRPFPLGLQDGFYWYSFNITLRYFVNL